MKNMLVDTIIPIILLIVIPAIISARGASLRAWGIIEWILEFILFFMASAMVMLLFCMTFGAIAGLWWR